jgi:hypothetical protein
VVTADGTLHMSLMRSCSAWPSGIWIDGDRRTAPDGSSFAWQHWSHTFEYALASGPGDWRNAGFAASAEDYAHDLIPVVSDSADAAVPAELSFLAVEPGNVTVSAVKPRGNPLASGRIGALGASGADGPAVTVRLRETHGRPATARVRFPGAAGISRAWLTDLLEESDGDPLPVADGAVIAGVPAFGTVTLVVQVSSRAAAGGGHPPPAEPVQPVYTRYWLHGKGPAPAGNLPVAVHFSPTRAALSGPGEAAALRLTVGCGPEPASGAVELAVPDEVTVGHAGQLRYELAPGGYAAWDLTVRVQPGTATGRYFVAARIRDPLGQLAEDVTMVAVGERRWPDPGLPPEEALDLMQADYRAGAAEVDLAVLTPEVRLTPGGQGELLVRVTSGLASVLHGEAQLVSPFGTWQMLGPPAQGFSAAPGASAVLRFGVSAPATARPGTRCWGLVKVMYYGRVRYTEAVPVSVEGCK